MTALMGVPKSWSNKKRDAALAGTIRPTGKPDWDNFAKMLDAFNEIVWIDDAQIVEGSIEGLFQEHRRFASRSDQREAHAECRQMDGWTLLRARR